MAEVERFVRVVAEARRGFIVLGALPVVTRQRSARSQHGVLNLLVAVARALTDGDVAEALLSTDGAALAAEARAWSPSQVRRGPRRCCPAAAPTRTRFPPRSWPASACSAEPACG